MKSPLIQSAWYEMLKDMRIVRGALRFSLYLATLIAACGQVHAQEQRTAISDPCSGPSALLAILDRPTVSDSACVVPIGRVVMEFGFQHATLRGQGGGTADNYPQAVFRAGLPGRNEFVLLAPNYTRQTTQTVPDSPTGTAAGLSAVTLGIKHSVGYTSSWLGAVEALFTLPSGGSAFGSRGLGVAANGIAAYSLTDQIGLALQLGVSSQTDPKGAGGERFTSFISNLVATWQPTARLQFYGEIFGQSKTGPDKGAGYNADGGVQYLLTPFWEVDVEGGVRLTGDLGGYTHYLGAGMGFRF
jgi:hypothetical protein